MWKNSYILLVIFFLPGCFVANDMECAFRFFPEEGGSYSTTTVPDLSLAVGDTLFLDVDNYWDYQFKCEDYGDEPDLESFLINSDIVELHRQQNSVFIIGKKVGVTEAMVIGNAYLLRNSSYDDYPVKLPLSISVGTESNVPIRQRAIFPPTGRIDSVRIIDFDRDGFWRGLKAFYSAGINVEDVEQIESWWALYSPTGSNIVRFYSGLHPLLTAHGGNDNEISLNIEGLQGRYYGYVQIEAKKRTFGRTFYLDF